MRCTLMNSFTLTGKTLTLYIDGCLVDLLETISFQLAVSCLLTLASGLETA